MTRLDNDARWLINEIAETRRMATALAKPQLGTSSIEAGRIEEYDKDGTLVQIIGEQHDGTHTTNTVGGPVPPEPAAPAVTAGIGSVEARWSGKFADNVLSPMDFSHVSLHASRVSVFAPSNATQLATITGELGDAAVVLIDPGEWTFGLVAVSKAGKWSPLSETVTIDVPDFPSPVDIQDELIRFDEVTGGLITETGKIGEKLDQAADELEDHETRLVANEGVIGDLKDNVLPGLESSMDNLRDVEFPAMNQRIAVAEAELAETGAQLNERMDTAFIRVAGAEQVSAEAKAAAATAQTAADTALSTATTQINQIIARGQNLVRNGDFEAGSDGWRTDAFSAVESGNSRSGAKALRIGPNPGGNIWPTSEWVPSSPGRTYYAEYWVKRSGTEVPNLGVGFVLQVKTAAGGTASHTVGRIEPSSISTSQFTKVTLTFKPTTADITNIRFASWIAAGNNVYYVDDFLAVDVTEAQAAIEAAATAQQKAQEALTAAGSAQDTATSALTMAGTKNAVFYGTTSPTGNGTSKGDLWRQVDATGDVIGEWQWTGTSWAVRMVSSSAISNLDLGKLTAGTAFVAEAVIEKLWVEVIRARKILVDQIVIGQGENLVPWDLSTGDPAAWGHISGYSVGGANPGRQVGAGVAEGNHLYMVAPDTITTISNTWRIGSRPYSAPMGSTGWTVEPGEELKASFYVRAGGSYPSGIMPKIAVGLVWYTAAGVYIATTTATPEPLTWSWTKREAKGKAPAAAAYCLIYLRQDAPGGVRMDLPSLYRVKDGGLIATGAITGDHVEANSVAAKIARFLELEAGQITSGTIATARLNALEIAAATATFQTVDVKNLYVTTGTMTEAVINKLWADVVMSRKATFNMLAVGDFQNYIATGLGYNNEAIDWAAGLTPDLVDVPPGASVAFKSAVGQGNKGSTASRFDVVAGDEYEFVVWVKANVPNSRIYIEVRDQNGAHAMTSTRIDDSDLFYGNTSYPVSGAVVPTTWTKWRARMIPKPGVRQAYIATIYFNHSSGSETNAQVSIAGLSVKRRFGGEVIIDGSLKAKQLDVEDLAANQGFIADLTARIVKADMFVGKEFQGGTFTGNTFQSHTAPDIGVKLDGNGFRAYGPEGGEPVTEIRANGGTVYAVTDPATGDTLAALDADGGVTGKSLNIEGEATMAGVPIMGGTNLEGFSTDYGSGLLDFFPRAMVVRGYRDTREFSATNREGEILELSYDNLPSRGYRIEISPMSVYIRPGVTGVLCVYQTRDGSRPTMNSPLIHRIVVRNSNSADIIMPIGGSFYDLGSAGRVRYLFTFRGEGGQMLFGNFNPGSVFRVWVEDIGFAPPETGINRTAARDLTAPAPPAPPEKETENYVQTWTPSGYRSFDGSSRYTYADGKNRMYQGDGPYAGMLRSVAVFGNGSRGELIATALSGATITSMRVTITFPHWWYGTGGTAELMLHGANSLPTTLPSMTQAAWKAKVPRGGTVTLAIPSSYWNGFKNGTYRGIGLGAGNAGLTYYGYAKGSSVKLEIKYTK